MTYLQRFNALSEERYRVTRERTGLALHPESMAPDAFQADLDEAARRLRERA